MADLDDFFAKKDKTKKSKKKAKNLVSELLPEFAATAGGALGQSTDQPTESLTSAFKAVAVEEPKPTKKSKKKKDEANGVGEEEDEWIVEPEDKDYSGLRIQDFNIKQQEDDAAAAAAAIEEAIEYDEDGEIVAKEEPAGPWQPSGQPPPQQPQQPKEAAPAPPKAPAIAGPSKYVPPALRGGAAGVSMLAAPLPRSRFRRVVAPNLTSQSDFPTLGQDCGDPRDVSNFEEVKGSYSGRDTRQVVNEVSVANKFSALNK